MNSLIRGWIAGFGVRLFHAVADDAPLDLEDDFLDDQGRDVADAFQPLSDRQQVDRGVGVLDVAWNLRATPVEDLLVEVVHEVVGVPDLTAEVDVLLAVDKRARQSKLSRC